MMYDYANYLKCPQTLAPRNHSQTTTTNRRTLHALRSDLDVLDKVGCAIGDLLGSLHKVSLGHWVAGLAGGLLAGIAKYTGVLGYHRSSCQDLGEWPH